MLVLACALTNIATPQPKMVERALQMGASVLHCDSKGNCVLHLTKSAPVFDVVTAGRASLFVSVSLSVPLPLSLCLSHARTLACAIHLQALLEVRNADGQLPSDCAGFTDEHLALCLSAWDVLVDSKTYTFDTEGDQ